MSPFVGPRLRVAGNLLSSCRFFFALSTPVHRRSGAEAGSIDGESVSLAHALPARQDADLRWKFGLGPRAEESVGGAEVSGHVGGEVEVATRAEHPLYVCDEGLSHQESALSFPGHPPRGREEDFDSSNTRIWEHRSKDSARVCPENAKVVRTVGRYAQHLPLPNFKSHESGIGILMGLSEKAHPMIEANLHDDSLRSGDELEHGLGFGAILGLLEDPTSAHRPPNPLSGIAGLDEPPVHFQSLFGRAASRVARRSLIVLRIVDTRWGVLSMIQALVSPLLTTMTDRKLRGQWCTALGMLSLLTGNKMTALGLIAQGARDLEAEWRVAHPDFQGGVAERWRLAIEFYEATHANKANRLLHVIGIPIIAGGTTGLIIFPRYSPPWVLSAGSFTFGWVLNFVGHGIFEKNKPAFADDPLSFLAGPAWDLMNLKHALAGGEIRSAGGSP